MDSRRSGKDEAILTSVAESIGATLGTIAAKAGTVQRALSEKVAGVKPQVRRAKAVATKAVAKKRATMRRARRRKSRRGAGRSARRGTKKS